jgi:hypothetical protein
MTTRQEVEGFGSIKQLAAIGPQALAEAEKLLEDNKQLSAELITNIASLQVADEKIALMKHENDAAADAIRRQQQTISELQQRIIRLQPDATRYLKLRNCSGDKLPRTSAGVMLGGEMLDKAVDAMP